MDSILIEHLRGIRLDSKRAVARTDNSPKVGPSFWQVQRSRLARGDIMTRDIKYLVLALAMATAAIAPPSLRGVKDAETVGDTFEMSLAKAVDTTPKLRGASEGMASRPAGRGLEFGQYQTGKPTVAPTAEPTPAPTLPVGGPAAATCLAAGGDCNLCCGGCTRKTPGSGTDFSGLDDCVCFEGELPDYASLTLTNSNDCVKVTYVYGGAIRARVQRPLHLREPAPRAS